MYERLSDAELTEHIKQAAEGARYWQGSSHLFQKHAEDAYEALLAEQERRRSQPRLNSGRRRNGLFEAPQASRRSATVLGGGLHEQGAWALLRVSPAYRGHRFLIASASEAYYKDGEVGLFPANINGEVVGGMLGSPVRGDTRLWVVLPRVFGFDILPNTPA